MGGGGGGSPTLFSFFPSSKFVGQFSRHGVGVSSYVTNLSDKQASKNKLNEKSSFWTQKSWGGGGGHLILCSPPSKFPPPPPELSAHVCGWRWPRNLSTSGTVFVRIMQILWLHSSCTSRITFTVSHIQTTPHRVDIAPDE